MAHANNPRSNEAAADAAEMAVEVAAEAVAWVDPETVVDVGGAAFEMGGGVLEATLGILGGLLDF